MAANSNSEWPLSAPTDKFALEDVKGWTSTELQGLGATLSAMSSTRIVCFALDCEEFYRCLSDGPLGSFLVVTANCPTNAIANTMRQYVTWRWGTAGWDINPSFWLPPSSYLHDNCEIRSVRGRFTTAFATTRGINFPTDRGTILTLKSVGMMLSWS